MSDSSAEALKLLAQHVQSERVEYDHLGCDLTQRLSLSLLDLLGCHLASVRMGANTSMAPHFVQTLAPDAGATVWASKGRALPAQAALVNGTIAHHAEFDGGWHGLPRVGSHPAITVLPAALAVAEARGASGREFIAAAAAGYDVLAAMARCLSPAAVAHRLHPPGLLGSFGAAAASARLLHRNVPATETALAVCAGVSPMCPFESFTAGSSAKDLYGGWPAAVGVLAASSRTTTAHAFTLPRLLGRGPLSIDEIAPHLGSPALADADFKAFPACRTVHPALTALESMLASHSVNPDEVEAMDVQTYAYAVELDAVSDTRRPIGARTSVLMCLALRLWFGPLQPHHFTDENLRMPTLRALCDASSIGVGRYAGQALRGATVSLRLRSGACISASVKAEKWSHMAPASTAQILEKFHMQAESSLPPRDRSELIERVMNLQDASSVRFISEILSRSSHRVEIAGSSTKAGPQDAVDADEMRMQRQGLLEVLTGRGADCGLLNETFAAVDQACRALDPAAQARVLTLSLALMPASAGPVPPGWPAHFGRQIAALARTGFSGPKRVVTGPRGLHHLGHPVRG